MTYKCLECGYIFGEGEQASWKEMRAQFDMYDCYETICGCPVCGGDFDLTVKCDICGSDHLSKDLINGVCEDCIEDYKYDVDVCYNIGKNQDEDVSINLFLATMFTKEEIEEILFKSLLDGEKVIGKIDCKKFIDLDKSWFAECLVEEVNNSENAKG